MIKFTILNDNRCNSNQFKCEHGLSIFIECYGKRILFDCGQTDIFLKNAKILNIDLNNIDYVILSHGDYDHGNGIKYLKTKTNLLCHPNFLNYRISKRTGNFDGLNRNEQKINQNFNLIKTKKPYYITDSIIFLGEIDRVNTFEKDKNLPMIDKKGDTYQHLDDSGLVIKTDGGIIVISGCAHSGICNTVDYAKKLTGDNTVLAVIGGFHLKEIDEQTNKTIEYMKNKNIKKIFLAHCTSDIVCDEFKRQLSEKTEIISTGKIYNF